MRTPSITFTPIPSQHRLRLLSIGLRVLTLLEFTVRRRLAQEGTELAGLYAGNPKRTTARPTAERILEAFQDIALTLIQEPYRSLHHLTPLSELQLRFTFCPSSQARESHFEQCFWGVISDSLASSIIL